jgi:hypothetical protein
MGIGCEKPAKMVHVRHLSAGYWYLQDLKIGVKGKCFSTALSKRSELAAGNSKWREGR